MADIKKHYSKDFRNSDITFSSEQKTISYYQPIHWHDFFEIEYILEGSGEYIINGVSYEIKDNTLFFSTPSDFHEIKFDNMTKILNIQFAPEMVDSDIYPHLTNPLVFYDTDGSYQAYFKPLCTHGPSSGKYSNVFIRHMLNAALFLVYSNNKQIAGKKQYEINDYFYKIIMYINKNFQQQILLTELSKQMNLSSEYICRLFKKHSGQTIGEYITNVRLNHALRLVSNTKIPINEISILSGYNSYPHFIRTFKEKFGNSPNKMRKKLPEPQTTDNAKSSGRICGPNMSL